jgi:putative nucleotidyltransferase with HDIG domain
MLKRIGVKDLRVGMYVSELCHSLDENPFWKGKFLDREHDLLSLDGCDIVRVVIDTSKGLDVLVTAEALDAPADSLFESSLEAELVRAQALCARSKAAVVQMFSHARMGQAIECEHINQLVDDISSSVARHPNAFISLARLKNADEYTYMHSVAVCALMIALARQLDLPPEQVHKAGLAGLLHDVGKMTVPGAILNKPGKLTVEEFAVVRQHARSGVQLLQASEQVCELVLDVCLHHHEKIDGSGYPDQLLEQQISVFARMAAVCDVYDAITSDRSYNDGWDPAMALKKMSEWEGHFDGKVFQAFVKTVGIYPVGSIVRLKSGSIGVVMEQHPLSLLTPKVKVFFSTLTHAYVTPRIIDISASEQTEKIVERVPLQRYGFKHTEALWAGSQVKK